MPSPTQLARYKKLLTYIEQHFKEEINIEKVEAISHYSYRNINRIFEAIHQETIGKYIKRLRLEKAAQYLLYSDLGVADIAHAVGFEDRAGFSKAFKQKFGHPPSTYRAHKAALIEAMAPTLTPEEESERQALTYEIAYLPEFTYLFLEHRGDYEDLAAIEASWEKLLDYAQSKDLLTTHTQFMAELIDDNEISDRLHTRHNLALVLERPLDFEPEGHFRTQVHAAQRYVKFVHEGNIESYLALYQQIFAYWMQDIALELKDLPILEFYPNFEAEVDSQTFLQEIYIPVR